MFWNRGQVLGSVLVTVCLSAACGLAQTAPLAAAPERKEYRVLATTKTSTMQKEMNEAAAAGFQFDGVMGGGTSFGG